MLKRSSKTFLCLLVFLFVIFSVTIVSSKGNLSIGIQGGVNFANASVEPDIGKDYTARIGLMVGGLMELDITQFFAFKLDLLYVEKGAKWETETNDTTSKSTWKFDYVEFPMLFKAKFEQPMFEVNVFIGPNLGILLNAKGISEVGGESMTIDFKEITRPIDIAFDFGGGGEFAFNPKVALFTNIRYSLGVYDIDETDIGEWKSNGIQILAGTKFTL